MEFFALLGIGFTLFCLITFILPWIQRGDIQALRTQMDELQARVRTLEHGVAPQSAPVVAPPVVTPPEATPEPAPVERRVSILPEVVAQASAPLDEPVMREGGFEFKFGAQLPVWIGGIALALAGFFLVKYSIEMGLLNPLVRVVLGLLFGAGLVAAAYKVGPRNARIGQSLAGAGIADLYVSLFAATSLYGFLPQFVGLMSMAAVTALAMVMALRHGAPIAVLGMVGGFLTPLMVGSHEPNTPLLLLYLYVLFTALFTFIRRQAWWGLALLMTPLALLWALVLMVTASPGEMIFVGMFLLAISATVVAGTRGLAEVTPAVNRVNALAIGIGAVMIGVSTALAGFGVMERGLLFLLAAGGLGLAYFDYARYRFVPALTVSVSLVALAAWAAPDALSLKLTLALFALLHIGFAGFATFRSPRPVFWSLVATLAAAFFYLLAYVRMGAMIETITLWPLVAPKFWGLLALVLASLAVKAAQMVAGRTWESEDIRQHLLAVFATAATGFIALGLTIELDREFLSVCFAAEVLALSLLNAKLNVRALRPLAGVMSVAFAAVLLPQIILLLQLSAYTVFEAQLYLQESVPMVNWPLFQLGLPALFFAMSAYLLRKKEDGTLVQAFEVVTVALVGVMGYYVMRHAFHPNQDVLFVKAGFVERGVFTNALFVFGLLCAGIATRWSRAAIGQAGLVLVGVGLFRLGWFDLLHYNPLWENTQTVGDLPFVNALTLTYGLPILWLSLLRHLPLAGRFAPLGQKAQGILAFVWASFMWRHAFHGTSLARGSMSDAELYGYSVLWLLMAVGMLVQGTRRNLKTWRVTALVLVIIVVGKVFLIDASALTGLWRVFSFLGLGLSLMSLTWFYNRFIPNKE